MSSVSAAEGEDGALEGRVGEQPLALEPLEPLAPAPHVPRQREFFIDNLLVRIHFIIVMMRWTGIAPWEFEFPIPGSLTPTFPPRHVDNVSRGRNRSSSQKCEAVPRRGRI